MWIGREGNFPDCRAVRPSRDKFNFKMLSFQDQRWNKLLGGYRTVFDPRPALENLESNVRLKEAWHELWEELQPPRGRW